MNSTISFSINTVFNALLEHLPRYSEEGSDASVMDKQETIIALTNEFGEDQHLIIQTTLELVESLLMRCSLLETSELSRGVWKFVSHPAQLCALSFVHTLADAQQKLFPANFWHTAGIGDDEKQQQKQVLAALETRRYACHLNHAAPPIRFVYVAWGLIKLDNQILFHQRETKEHRDEYGLIGGRVNAADLRKVLGENTPNSTLLHILQASYSDSYHPQLEKALAVALERECKEEIGLTIAKDHYSLKIWRDLAPWQACMGGAPNYALTQYVFRLYHFQLTTPGYLELYARLRQPNSDMIGCSLAEVEAGKTVNGAKKLTIDALYADFADDRAAFRQALDELAASYVNHYLFNEEKDALIFSLESELLCGSAGKERPLAVVLSREEKSLLFGLAAHAKGFDLRLNSSKMIRHEYGWMEIGDADLEMQCVQLSERLRAAGMPYLEMVAQHYVRLALPPELIFFDPAVFRFELQQQDKNVWCVRFYRITLSTVLGEVVAINKECILESGLGRQLHKVVTENFSVFDDENLPKKVRSALQKVYQPFGLRQLLVTKDKCFRLVLDSLPQ